MYLSYTLKLNDLNNYKEASDAYNYAILAHSLKSDARYLGFTKLAELAYNHEMAGKNNDIDFINYIKDRYNLNRSSTDPKNEHAILPRYIRLSHLCRKKVGDKVEYGEVTTLFRVCETPNGLLLIGVPKLDRNETYSGSINQDNNKNPFNNNLLNVGFIVSLLL